MAKPASITGIQAILWIFAAVAAVANLFAAMSMANLFNAMSLVSLIFAVYSTIQSIISAHPDHARQALGVDLGARRARSSGWCSPRRASCSGSASSRDAAAVSLLIGIVLGGLYGTLLTVLLLSKSARDWILMHRVQRGEVQVPGHAGAGYGPAAGAGPIRERLERIDRARSVASRLALWGAGDAPPLAWIWIGLQ